MLFPTLCYQPCRVYGQDMSWKGFILPLSPHVQRGQGQPKFGVYYLRLLSCDSPELRSSPFITQLSPPKNCCPTHLSLAPFLLLFPQVPRAMLAQVQDVTFPAAQVLLPNTCQAIQTSDQRMLPRVVGTRSSASGSSAFDACVPAQLR